MSFSKWIRSRMEKKKLNASELARALSLSPAAISHWLNDRNLPKPATKEELPEILGVSLAEVLLIVHQTELRRAK